SVALTVRRLRSASSASWRCMSPTRSQLGAQSFHSTVDDTTRSKSFTSIPFAMKRGRQWPAAICTRFRNSADIGMLLDALVLCAPGVQSSALVVVVESIGLLLHQLPVQLGPPVVRLSGPAAVDRIAGPGCAEHLLVVVARADGVEARHVQIRQD